MYCTIQVSNHPAAGQAPAPAAAAESWQTVYFGTVRSRADARQVVDELAQWFAHARVFLGLEVGRLDYHRNGDAVVYRCEFPTEGKA